MLDVDLESSLYAANSNPATFCVHHIHILNSLGQKLYHLADLLS